MSENSGYWDTNGTGDGASAGYTEDEVRQVWELLTTSDNTTEGVAKGYLNELAVTGTSSPVSVDTGGGAVYGFWYINDSSTTVAVPTPSSDTRIDRIVLEADWSAQTVRLARVAGTEGGSAPALTQTAGTTWQISLAQVSITTGGVITVTDERSYLPGNFEIVTAHIADSAITDAKLRDSAALTVIGRSANSTGDPADISAGTDGHVLRRSGTTLAFGTIVAAGIASDAVTTVKIIDAAVTNDKLANSSIVITQSGGNARGTNATDLQVDRASNTSVASGDNSVIAGGEENKATGASSTISGGAFNTASGDFSSISGGTSNQSSGEHSSVSGGTTALADKYGQNAHAAGQFSSAGDAQTSRFVARNSTTDATQTELFLDGVDDRMTMVDDTTWVFSAMIVARRTDADNESAGYKIEGVIDRNAGTTALVGSITKTVLAEDTAAWDVTAEADDTNDALVIKVTGEASKTIQWVARVETVETTG